MVTETVDLTADRISQLLTDAEDLDGVWPGLWKLVPTADLNAKARLLLVSCCLVEAACWNKRFVMVICSKMLMLFRILQSPQLARCDARKQVAAEILDANDDELLTRYSDLPLKFRRGSK